jgi:hypothetical protein
MAAGAEPSCAAMSHISHARWPTHRLQPRMLMTLRDFRNTFLLCHYTTYQVQPLVQRVQYNLPVAPTLLHGANTRSTSSRSTGQPASLTASASRWPPSKSKLTQARLCLTPVCFMLELVLSNGRGEETGVEKERNETPQIMSTFIVLEWRVCNPSARTKFLAHLLIIK